MSVYRWADKSVFIHVQSLHSSGVPLPAAARRAAECAAALPAAVAAPAEAHGRWEDEERWLRFTAAMEAAGALGRDTAPMLPAGMRVRPLADLTTRARPLPQDFPAEVCAEASARPFSHSAILDLAAGVLAHQALTAQ